MVLGMQGHRSSWGSLQHGQPSLLLYFIAALILQHRRRLIDECRDQACFPFSPVLGAQCLRPATF